MHSQGVHPCGPAPAGPGDSRQRCVQCTELSDPPRVAAVGLPVLGCVWFCCQSAWESQSAAQTRGFNHVLNFKHLFKCFFPHHRLGCKCRLLAELCSFWEGPFPCGEDRNPLGFLGLIPASQGMKESLWPPISADVPVPREGLSPAAVQNTRIYRKSNRRFWLWHETWQQLCMYYIVYVLQQGVHVVMEKSKSRTIRA